MFLVIKAYSIVITSYSPVNSSEYKTMLIFCKMRKYIF